MKRIVFYLLFLLPCWLISEAQPKEATRPSLYDLVKQVRVEVGLDHKQFDKVYSAYEKFDKAVFGDRVEMPKQGEFSKGPRPGGAGGHKPGGGAHMGRGNAHGGGGSDFLGNPPGGNSGESAPSQRKAPKPEDFENMIKAREKQEAKLDKTMKKIFKKETEKYYQWKELRERQLVDIFPTPDSHF